MCQRNQELGPETPLTVHVLKPLWVLDFTPPSQKDLQWTSGALLLSFICPRFWEGGNFNLGFGFFWVGGCFVVSLSLNDETPHPDVLWRSAHHWEALPVSCAETVGAEGCLCGKKVKGYGVYRTSHWDESHACSSVSSGHSYLSDHTHRPPLPSGVAG